MRESRRAIFVCLLLGWVSPLSAAWAAWPGVPYTGVRGFAWPSDRVGNAVVLPGLQLARGAKPPTGRALSPEQIDRLLKAQTRRYTPRPLAGCYAPHHAFVFYEEAKPVAYLEICLDCLSARVWPEDPECDPDFLALGQLCVELKFPLGRFKHWAEFRAATASILGDSARKERR